MMLAPHPDDEALGTGGLIQQANAAGAKVRVVFTTDGDNNPWPQRYVERRWFINAECRQRWGAQRRGEALNSVRTLGLSAKDAAFMGFPDAYILKLWKQRDVRVLEAFVSEFRDFKPTHLVVPSPQDGHPDHRGVYEFAQEALRITKLQPAQYSYLIHRQFFHPHATGISVQLSPSEQQTKLSAILCHLTQMHLSRGRFVGYAKAEEIITPEPLPFHATPLS